MNARSSTWCVLLLVSSTYGLPSPKAIPNYAGPYNVIVREFVDLSDKEAGTRQVWMHGVVRSYRRGRPQVFSGRQVNTVPLSDEHLLTTSLAIRSNNQWKLNNFVNRFPRFCSDGVKYIRPEMDLIFGGPECPVPVGDRIIENRTINLTYPMFPTMPYRRFLMINLLHDKSGRTIGGYSIDLEVVPKV